MTITTYRLEVLARHHASAGTLGLQFAESSAVHAERLDREDELVVGI